MTEYLELEAKIWDKESFHLFDYESKTVMTRSFRINNDATLKKTSDMEIKVFEDTYQSSTRLGFDSNIDFKDLVSFYNDEGNYFAEVNGRKNCEEDDIWVVHRKKKKENEKFYIKENDTIKIGKIILKLISINLHSKMEKSGSYYSNNNSLLMREAKPKSEEKPQSNDNSEEKVCRICLSEQNPLQNDPLVSLCKCSGSMKYSHASCLKIWLKNKIVIRNQYENMIEFDGRQLQCELCLQELQIKRVINGVSYDFLGLDELNKNYVIFEDQYKHVMIVQFEIGRDFLIVGRGHECDFKISDITVSRNHCKIIIENGKLVVEDCGSKFGTLLKMNSKILIDKKKPLVLLCGRVLIIAKKYKRWKFFNICCSDRVKCGRKTIVQDVNM